MEEPCPERTFSICKGEHPLQVSIDGMQKAEIEGFLRTWTRLLYGPNDTSASSKYLDELYTAITENSRLLALARNPVMLTSMAVVHYNERRLPVGRTKLLESVVHWLIHAKERYLRKGEERTAFISTIYGEIALAMQQQENTQANRIGRQEAAKTISHHFGGSHEAALSFLEQEEYETGLLVRRGVGDLSFWHAWFQEFLAAREIAGMLDDAARGWWTVVKDHLDDEQWRETLSLVPPCLHRLGTERVNLFFQRLGDSLQSLSLSTKIKRLALWGRIAAEIALQDPKTVEAADWSKYLSFATVLFTQEGTRQLEDVSLAERFEAALAFGISGDERLKDFDSMWVPIAGGTFFMGAQSESEEDPNYDPDAIDWQGPVTKVQLPSFEIRKFPITVQEFARFVDSGGYTLRTTWTDQGWDWKTRKEITAPLDWPDQKKSPNCPVTGISWYEAAAYCNWLTEIDEKHCFVYRLPSEAQWEYVATRDIAPGRLFPWGDSLDRGDNAQANWAGCGLRKKTPVGLFPLSNTQNGVADLFGNVEEWCADTWSESHEGYPSNGCARMSLDSDSQVVRGGSAIRFSRLCKPKYRSRIRAENRYHTVGCRPVRQSEGSSLPQPADREVRSES